MLRQFLARHSNVNAPEFKKYIEEGRGLTVSDVAPYELGFFRHSYQDYKDYKIPKALDKSIVLPVFDDLHQPIGFELRTTEGKQHFKFFDPNGRFFFFGLTPITLAEIFNTETVFLAEGTFDTITFGLWKKNSLGIMTSKLSEKHFTFLRRYVKTVYLCLDFDPVGKQQEPFMVAALKKAGFDVHVFNSLIQRDQVKDANAYIKKYGRQKFLTEMSGRFRFL